MWFRDKQETCRVFRYKIRAFTSLALSLLGLPYTLWEPAIAARASFFVLFFFFLARKQLSIRVLAPLFIDYMASECLPGKDKKKTRGNHSYANHFSTVWLPSPIKLDFPRIFSCYLMEWWFIGNLYFHTRSRIPLLMFSKHHSVYYTEIRLTEEKIRSQVQRYWTNPGKRVWWFSSVM